MQVDLPEVMAEVREAFERYEQALVANDVAALDAMFRTDERTIRYGVAENLYGYKEVAAFRAARSPINLMRTRSRTVITTYGRDFAVVSTLFHRQTLPGKVGRQMQTWVRFEDGWRVVAAHVSIIGRPLPPLEPLSAVALAGTVELVVVGAHLSGLTLNHQLRALGGTFLRTVETEPSYELYALPGGPPERPGLVRVAAGTGHAIATEVWALPVEGFGRFVAGIPAPLGIGTLLLADGTRPKGFLCEAEAIRSARRISSFGGWRAYLAAKG
jgi:hypothetical protein